MGDPYWLTDEQMARLEPYFPKSQLPPASWVVNPGTKPSNTTNVATRPQPDRDHVRPSQGLAARRHTLRQVPRRLLLRHRPRRNRHILILINESSRNCGCFPRTSAEAHTSGCRILKEGSSHEALCRIGPVDGKHAGLHR